MPQNILFIHGYSETSLGAYHAFPRLLNEAGINVLSIFLSAFDSLDDQISIADLADALEDHIAGLESDPAVRLDMRACAIICHSTGALISRRWLLNRVLCGNKAIPSHLITMAGAHHGSSLAQVGKSVLGYAQKLLLNPAHALKVGERVLTDLDYGSDFLLRLNHEWLTALNDPTSILRSCYLFSLGGDCIGTDPMTKLIWGSCETGSDNTVRISGANLNYRMIDIDESCSPPRFITLVPGREIPHLILPGYSHYDTHTGIVGKAQDASDPALQRVLQALHVQDDSGYQAVAQEWSAFTAQWSDPAASLPGRVENVADHVNATVVFSLFDRDGSPIDECMIAFLNASQVSDANNPMFNRGEAADATLGVSNAINAHSPIQNQTQCASYSFYLNWPKWKDVDHIVHVEAHSPSARINYDEVNYRIPPEIGKLIRPNEFTYVRVCLGRNTDKAYALYRWDSTWKLETMTWGPDLPFPPGSIPLS